MHCSHQILRVAAAACLLSVAACGLGAAEVIRFRGTVESMDRANMQMVVRPDPSLDAGLEDPLTVRVGPGDLRPRYLEVPIEGRLLRSGGGWRLETIWPREPVEEQVMSDVNTRLRRDTATRGRRMVRMTGDLIPQFALYDQEGRLVQARDLRGNFVVINFIFTRCPIPTMCPANTTRMARLQREVAQRGWEDVHLVSISLDPEYDTPGILNYYATTRGIDLENFSFLSGPKEAVDDILRQFGILTMEKDGSIDHTMATLIVDPNGKIIYRRDGPRWSVENFIDRIAKLRDN